MNMQEFTELRDEAEEDVREVYAMLMEALARAMDGRTPEDLLRGLDLANKFVMVAYETAVNKMKEEDEND